MEYGTLLSRNVSSLQEWVLSFPCLDVGKKTQAPAVGLTADSRSATSPSMT